MPRKTSHNPAAQTAAADMIEARVAETNGGDVAAIFESAEFETATSRVGGQEIALRRIVLTSPWEVASHEYVK